MLTLRRILEACFIIIFIVLVVILGRMQPWIALTLILIAASLVLGRLYCGFVCPILTTACGVEKLNKNTGRKVKEVPQKAKHPLFAFSILGLFLAALILIMKSGINIPVFLILLVIGAALTFFYHPSLWHRYLCPFGTVFRLISRFPIIALKVHGDSCTSCGLCQKVCPADAITINENTRKMEIDKRKCLLCLRCKNICPQEAINFKNSNA